MYRKRFKVLSLGPEALEPVQSSQPDSEILRDRNLLLFRLFHEDQSTFLLRSPVKETSEPGPVENIAVLNKGDAAVLSEFSGFCRFEVYSTSSQWTTIVNGTTAIEKNTFVFIDILLYGTRKCS
jgi:hypothetical protein